MARTTDPEDHALGGARTLPLHTGREALALAASRRVASPLDGGAEPRREIRRSGLLSGNDDSLDDVTTSALSVVRCLLCLWWWSMTPRRGPPQRR